MHKIILTNDDGIESPGLAALHQACAALGERVVVAPAGPRSGSGHAVTTQVPIPVKTLANDWYAVGGMPADCIRVALSRIAPEASWIFSGINHGGNLGVDTYISGTVAAAREATFLGYRAVAISQYVCSSLPLDWEWSMRQARAVLALLMDRPARPGSFWNVNLPHLPPGAAQPEVIFCNLDPGPLEVRFRFEADAADGTPPAWLAHYEGSYANRKRHSGSDVDICFAGNIAVTEVPTLDSRCSLR